MAATLKLRRGTPSGSIQQSELFYDKDIETVVVGDGSGSNTQYKILAKLDESNSGSLNISGNITGSNILATNITATGDLTIGGNLFLGNQDTDNIVISADLSSSIIPDTDDTFDLGSNSKKWRHIYATSASIDNITLNGSGIVSSSQQISNYNTFLEIDGDGVFSGSSQVDFFQVDNLPAGLVSGSSQVSYVGLSNIPAGILSGSEQITDLGFISSSDSTTSLNTFTSSIQTEVDGLSAETASYLTSSGSVDYTDITSKPTLVSGSSQITYGDVSSIPSNIISSSNNSTTVVHSISNGEITSNLIGGVVSGSSQITITESQISDLSHTDISSLNSYTSSNDINITNIHSTTSSFESRLDLLSDVSHSHSNKANLDVINQDLSTTSDVTFNTGSFTGNMTITGDLTVLGSATEISSTELRIEDKLITVASGSVDSAAADGAGIEIDGANKSIQWDHNTTSFVLDAKVSSSVGFKGEGGELTGIDTDQVTEGSNLYYTDTRVKTKLDNDDIHSGSYLGTATTTNLSEGSNLYYTDARVKTKLDTETVISGSSQVIGILDSLNSYTSSNDLDISNIESTTSSIEDRLDNIETSTGSYLTTVDISSDTNLAVSDTSEVNMILSGDTLSAELIGGVVSGSSQITITESQISDLSHYTDSDVKNKLDTEGVISGSSFSSNHQGSITASINGTATNIDLGLNTNDSPTFSTLTLSSVASGGGSDFDVLFDVSGLLKKRTLGTSAFLNVSASIADDPNSVPTTKAVNDALIEAGAGDITSVNTSNLYSSASTGLAHTGDGTTDGSGHFGNVGNVVLSIDTGSAHFTDGVTTIASGVGVPAGTVSGSSQITSLGFISSSDSILSLNAYTASNDINITNIHSTTSSLEQRVGQIESNTGSYDDQTVITSLNSYTASNDTTNSGQDSRLTNIEAATGSYLTTVDISSDTNLGVSDTTEVNMILTDDTISAELIGGVVSGSTQVDGTQIQNNEITIVSQNVALGGSIPLASITNGSGIVSGSSQLYSDLDLRYGNELGDGLVSSSEQVVDILDSLNTYTSSNDTDINLLESRLNNIESNTGSYDDQTNISSLNDYTSSNDNQQGVQDIRIDQLASETGSYLTTVDISTDTNLGVLDTSNIDMILDGDTLSANLKGNIVSGSSQVDVTATTNYSSINQYSDTKVKDKLDTEGVISGSSQVDHDSTTNFVANEHIDHSSISVGSGKGLSGGGTIDTNRSIFLDTGSAHFDDGIKKIIDGDGVISGSSQIASDISGSFTSVSASLDNRLDTLEGDTHENVLTFNDTATIDLNRSTNTITANVIGGIFSGSAQIAAGGDVSGNVNSLTVEKVQGVSLTSAEATQLAAIGTSTITSTQWGYLGGTNQELYTGADVTFNDINASGDVVISGDFTVLGSATEISTSELSIEDKLITVASGSANSSAANGGGIEIDRGSDANASITWNHSGTRFDINNGIHVTGTIQATDDIVAYASSDERLKNEITPIPYALEKINNISGNSFVWNTDKQDIYKGKDYGVIAQEIEKILPELVTTKENGYKAVKYDKLVSLLIEGIKELSVEVNELKEKINKE